MDNTTIYEFLQEKSVIPTGPGSYSDSAEMSNALKVFKKNSSSKIKGKKDVNFYDYDGSLIDSYSTEEFLQLSAMPANPSHDGLTAQGWNYTLPDAKEYVTKYDKLDIGQMYITDDGKTRIYISLKDGRLKPRLGLGIYGSVVVDWGDGSETDTMTGSSAATTVYQEHTYAAEGEYVISLDVTGTVYINGVDDSSSLLGKVDGDVNTNRTYLASITQVELGDNIISIGSSAFQYCIALTSITIPESVTSIGSSAFSGCYALTSITIPESVTSIGSNAFQSCYALTSITIPESVTSISSHAFQYCYALTSVTIPEGLTSIAGGAFQSCYVLTSVTIPEGVTSIGLSAFQYCIALTSITIPESVTSIGSSAFSGCYVLTSVTIPEGLTSIAGGAFVDCYNLISVTIPEGVTSIEMRTFGNCSALTSITIPEGVTSIDSNAFQNCYGLGFIKFRSVTPATVSNANAWTNLPIDCIIYVPQGSLSAYKNASNYPSSSEHTYVEY